MPREAQLGDYVRYQLPNGAVGTCLLVDEGVDREDQSRKMYFGVLFGISTVYVYAEEITQILNGGVGQWRKV